MRNADLKRDSHKTPRMDKNCRLSWLHSDGIRGGSSAYVLEVRRDSTEGRASQSPRKLPRAGEHGLPIQGTSESYHRHQAQGFTNNLYRPRPRFAKLPTQRGMLRGGVCRVNQIGQGGSIDVSRLRPNANRNALCLWAINATNQQGNGHTNSLNL